MESLPLLQTSFRVTGSTKAASAFNSTVQSGAIKVLCLQEFVQQSHAISSDLRSKDAASTSATVLVVLTFERIKKDGKEYICMHVTDLRGSDAILVCEHDISMSRSMKIEVHSVICLLKATIVHFQDALYLESPENQILLLGRAINVGICKHMSFTGGSCSNAIDTSVSVYCPAHTAGAMTTPNSVSLRLYEELSLVDSAMARARQTSKQIHFSSNLTFSRIVDHVINRRIKMELIKANRLKNKKDPSENTAEKRSRPSVGKLYTTLRTSLQKERENETTRATLCKTCQVVAMVPPDNCIKGGHNLETVYVKVHRYKCSTCSKIYKTVRKYGPSFPCSICFTNMWISTVTGPVS